MSRLMWWILGLATFAALFAPELAAILKYLLK